MQRFPYVKENPMSIYFAPMEGVTDVIYRNVYRAFFTGVDKYFMPFVSPTQTMMWTPKELGEVLPENNPGMYVVPQILTKHADHFVWAAKGLADMGYTEVNLNMGCPSGTVTGKGKGSGLLRDLRTLEPFLDEIFAHSPIAVSIKTRIGYLSEEEWPKLLALLCRYPIHELIIHPRTRKQFYKGIPFSEAYRPAFEQCASPIVLNGDLYTPDDIRTALSNYPKTSAVMLGRGLVGNPALAQEVNGGQPLTRDMLVRFHDQLCKAYLDTGNTVLALVRMRMVTYYMCSCFEDAHKPWKQIRKARTYDEYLSGAKMLFEEKEMVKQPYYCVLDD